MSDKTQYWINQNGLQQGPYTLEQLEEISLGDKTYVWSAGFDDWKPIADVPELAQLLSKPAPAVPEIPEIPQDDAPADDAPAESEPIVGQPVQDTVVVGQPVEGHVTMGQPVQSPVAEGQPVQSPTVGQPVQYATGQAVTPDANQGQQPYPACPPTNLVWAILSTILCCLPLGVVAIIYSTKVSKKYYEGDIAAAEHYSEVSAWWCIGTIVGGLVLSPFVSLIQMAIMGQ